jgi:hypothetical protein
LKAIPDVGVKTITEIARMLRRHGIEMQGLPEKLRRQLGDGANATAAADEGR